MMCYNQNKTTRSYETDDLVKDIAYQDDEISQINDLIEVEQITSLCDTIVEGHQVDASILLVENNVDEAFGSEDNIGSDDDNNMDEEHEEFE